MEKSVNSELLEFIRSNPSVYHVIGSFTARLRALGYAPLEPRKRWTLRPGGKYYVTRGGASLIALRLPAGEDWSGFRLSAAHSDSPGFRLKIAPELAGNGYVRLNTEPYGGLIMASWMDRPLSLAGRVLVRTPAGLASRLVNLDRDLLVIPSLAIHMDRSCNEGKKYLANVDMLPLLGSEDVRGSLPGLVAEAAGTAVAELADGDLYVYCREPGRVLGGAEEYLVSPRLDDSECAWGCMEGFLAGEAPAGDSLAVCCIFHNEEVGSATKQGAGSSFLRDTLRRVCLAMGKDEADFQALLAGSFLVSADNAHAIHPNHPEYADAQVCPRMNGGVVLKYNANQRYATDGVSAAVFRGVCEATGVPVQCYANRADLQGGSTLGSIADTLLPVATVDVGLAQLAMHSAVETAGSRDPAYLLQAMTAYYAGTLPQFEE